MNAILPKTKEIDFDNVDPSTQLVIMDQDNAYLVENEALAELLTKNPDAFDDTTTELMSQALFNEEIDLTDPTKTPMNVIVSILSNIGNEALESVWLEKTSISGGKLPPALQALAQNLDANKAAFSGSLTKNVSGMWTGVHQDGKVDANGVGNEPNVTADLTALNQYATAELLENGADEDVIKKANDADNSPLQTAQALVGVAATLGNVTGLVSLMDTKIDQTMMEQGITAETVDIPEQVSGIEPDPELIDVPTAMKLG